MNSHHLSRELMLNCTPLQPGLRVNSVAFRGPAATKAGTPGSLGAQGHMWL